MHRTRLRVIEPCDEKFDDMTGDQKSRFCAKCEKSVHHISGMTKVEAERLLAEKQGQSICVRYRTNARGQVEFKPVRPGARLGLVAAMSLSLAACAGYAQDDDLSVPDGVAQCQDAYGYSVPCDEVEPRIPDAEAVEQNYPREEAGGVVGGVVGGVTTEGATLGQMSVAPESHAATSVGGEAPDNTNVVMGGVRPLDTLDPIGCPIQPNDGYTVGEIISTPRTRRMARKERRASRRAARRARRSR